MSALLALASLLLAAATLLAAREARRHRVQAARLAEEVSDLKDRLETAELDAGRAVSAADATAALLVDKGLADEDEIEEARQRAVPGAESASARGGRTVH